MKGRIQLIVLSLIIFLFSSCSGGKDVKDKESQQKQEVVTTPQAPQTNFTALTASVFKIQTYNGTRILENGQGFLVGENIIAAPFSLFKQADRGILTPLNGEGPSFEVMKFISFDRISNVILLKAGSINANPLKFHTDSVKLKLKTIVVGEKYNNSLPLYTGGSLSEKIVYGEKLITISNTIQTVNIGTPVFLSNGYILGMGTAMDVDYERTYFAIPAETIIEQMKKGGSPKPISAIGNPDAKRNASIKSITLETEFGNIGIRLFNEVPEYRDNFIKLAQEGYYDNLLIHRVIRDFGIQTGAADTRNAKSDDIVGWKGPGYTIPAHIVKGLYHKRGVIGSPRLRDDTNKDKRSDGSQFYIVTGRKYLENELDEIEKDNGIKFTAEQREVYKTIGGSPHLDGQYTVFGEVNYGLDIADRISLFPVQGDFRPTKDIRLKKVKIVF